MKNLVNEKEMYVVVESFKGNEEIIFAGSREECTSFADQARIDLVKKAGEDVLTVNDFYIEKKSDRENAEEKYKNMDAYKKTLSEEELNEKIIIDGKTYKKWVIDFNKKYNK
jgi:hypothetical protein